MRKIAVIKNDKDIARISVFNIDNNNYEVKLSIFVVEFNIMILEAFKRKPRIKQFKEKDSELTFHISKEELGSVIHLKRKIGKPIRLIEKNLIDYDINIYSPIPLVKIYVPTNIEGTKKYKPKKYHELIKIDNNNVIELYLTHYGNSIIETGDLSLDVMLSFESLITNDSDYTKHKMAHFIGSKVPIRVPLLSINSNIALSAYPLESKIIGANNVTFIIGENKYSTAIQLYTVFKKPDLYKHINKKILGMKKNIREEQGIKFYYELLLKNENISKDLRDKITKDAKQSRKELRRVFQELKIDETETSLQLYV